MITYTGCGHTFQIINSMHLSEDVILVGKVYIADFYKKLYTILYNTYSLVSIIELIVVSCGALQNVRLLYKRLSEIPAELPLPEPEKVIHQLPWVNGDSDFVDFLKVVNYIYIYIYIHTCTYMCVCECMHVCRHASVCWCMCACKITKSITL